MRVELIFFQGCPNVEEAREQLSRALAEIGRPPQWQEWERDDPAGPAYASAYGSPTILVDGKDVAGVAAAEGADCCRLYRGSDGSLAGVPSVEQIVDALRGAGQPETPGGAGGGRDAAARWTTSLAVVPAVAAALIPSVTCPACWPAYAALLSSLGIGFLPTSKYLLPLTLAAVAFVLAMFGWQAVRRRRFAPLMLATAGAVVLLAGRFGLQAESAVYVGVGLLVAASVWNAWPAGRRTASGAGEGGTCPACRTATSGEDVS